VDLEPAEIRVLGCLLEKQRTTPDAYPLSLNALRLACNQATNRDPVVEYDEATVRDALHRLGRRRFTRLASGAGSRAPKYRHLLDEALPMGRDEQAIMCVLMLRGPQTPGELKQRADRLHGFPDLGAVGATLDRLIDRNLVARLGRRPGQKEERYRELLGEDAEVGVDASGERVRAREPEPEPEPEPDPPDEARREDRVAGPGVRPVAMPGSGPPALTALEARVGRLERAVAELRDEDRVGRLEREVAALREALGG
jgi:uncharacterized protein YceH (UPF0502 family)